MRFRRLAVLVLLLGLVRPESSCGSPVAANPIPIGSQKQLFIDHNFIASSEKISLVVNPPIKAPWPVLMAEKEALGSVMRAVLRRDGFVSADAEPEPGWFVTPPLFFAGEQLALNVDTGGGGHLRVEIQDAQGTPVPGYALADCDPVNGNRVDYGVSWRGKSDVAALAGKPVRLKLLMRSAKLFAFQFQPHTK